VVPVEGGHLQGCKNLFPDGPAGVAQVLNQAYPQHMLVYAAHNRINITSVHFTIFDGDTPVLFSAPTTAAAAVTSTSTTAAPCLSFGSGSDATSCSDPFSYVPMRMSSSKVDRPTQY
jgi:hypothetical protein